MIVSVTFGGKAKPIEEHQIDWTFKYEGEEYHIHYSNFKRIKAEIQNLYRGKLKLLTKFN